MKERLGVWKKYVVWLVCLCGICTFILSGCSSNTVREKTPFLLQVAKNQKIPTLFPATIKVNYFGLKDATFYGETHGVTFRFANVRFPYYEAYAVTKEKNGYVIHGSEYEGYEINDPTAYGFSSVMMTPEQNGEFEITFQDEYRYRYFHTISWDKFCDKESCLPQMATSTPQ